jgi:hypothetical protein
MSSRRFNYNIGFIGIQFPGTSAGSVSITSQSSGGSYNFNLPTSSGSSGQVLLSGGGGTNPMTWGSSQLNLSSRFLNSAFSLPTGSVTVIPFDGIDATNSLGVTGLNYSAGIFTNTLDTPIQLMLTVCANFIGSNAGYRMLYIQDNTGQIYGNVEQLANLNNSETGLSTSAQFVVGVGKSFGVYVFQNSGSSMTLESGTSGNTKMQMTSMMSIPTGGTINAILTSNTLGALITSTSGNVGIGIITPQAPLHIKGAILLENEATVGDNPHTYINFAETGFTDRFAIGCDFSGIGTANNLFITSNSNGSLPLISDSKVTMSMIGNVGISNTAPSYTLDIGGSLRATNTTLFTHNSNTIGNIFTTGGNVGIGTTSPSEKLHVNGNIKNTGYNYISSSTLTTGSAGTVLIATGSAGLYSGRILINATGGGGHSQFTIDISNCFSEINTVQTPSIIVKRSQWNGGTNVSNITICTAPGNGTYISNFFLTCLTGTALTITLLESTGGLSLTTPALTTLTAGYIQTVYPIASTGILHGAMGNYLTVNTNGVGINSSTTSYTLDVNGTFETSNTNGILLFASSGNVGIGTTAPSASLDVRGNIAITPSSRFTTAVNDNFIYAGNTVGHYSLAWNTDTGSTNGPMSYLAGYGGIRMFTLGTPKVSILDSGNVGIRTTAPNYSLQISQDNTGGYPGDTTAGQFVISGATDSTKRFGFQLDTTRNFGHIQVVKFGTTTYPLILNGQGGNIGIGTTSPSDTLTINGNIRLGPAADSNADYFIKSSGQLTIAANDASTQDASFTSLSMVSGVSTNQSVITVVGSSTLKYMSFATSNTERMRIDSTGNVGIGTSTPTQMLHIQKSGSDNYIKVDAGSTNSNNYSGIMFTKHNINFGWSLRFSALNDGLYISYQDNTPAFTDLVSFDRANRVGINTNSPAHTLDVNGTIARSGVKLPRFDNGTFSGASTGVIPILFNDTQYNYVEIKVRYQVSTVCNVTLLGSTSSNGASPFGGTEIGETTVKNSSQASPIYTTLGYISQSTEAVNIDNNFTIKIIRASGGSNARNHYTFDTVYCFSGFGTTRVYGMGHFNTATNLTTALLSIVMTASTGTISGTYSTHHSY